MAPELIEARTSPAATGAARPMVCFKRMRERGRVRAYLRPIPAALRADPLLGLAGTGEDHAAKAMATVRTQELIDRHGVVLYTTCHIAMTHPNMRSRGMISCCCFLGQLRPHQLSSLH